MTPKYKLLYVHICSKNEHVAFLCSYLIRHPRILINGHTPPDSLFYILGRNFLSPDTIVSVNNPLIGKL
jgi:hypothetical protein